MSLIAGREWSVWPGCCLDERDSCTKRVCPRENVSPRDRRRLTTHDGSLRAPGQSVLIIQRDRSGPLPNLSDVQQTAQLKFHLEDAYKTVAACRAEKISQLLINSFGCQTSIRIR